MVVSSCAFCSSVLPGLDLEEGLLHNFLCQAPTASSLPGPSSFSRPYSLATRPTPLPGIPSAAWWTSGGSSIPWEYAKTSEPLVLPQNPGIRICIFRSAGGLSAQEEGHRVLAASSLPRFVRWGWGLRQPSGSVPGAAGLARHLLLEPTLQGGSLRSTLTPW